MSIASLAAALKNFAPISPPVINNNSDLQNYVQNNGGFLGGNQFLKDIDGVPGGKADGLILPDDIKNYLNQNQNPTTGMGMIERKFAQTLLDKMTQFGDKSLSFDPNNPNGQISFTV
jgi:hypothetical protein